MKIVVGIFLIIVVVAGVLLTIRPWDTSDKKVSISPTVTPTVGPPKVQSDDETFIGEITKVDGRHIYVTVKDKEYNIVLTDHTFFTKGKTTDLVPGAKLGIIASFDEDGTYIARTIKMDATHPGELLKK